MTYGEIVKRVAKIESIKDKDDDESAHCEEDKLYHQFLKYIAVKYNCTELGAFARAILATEKIKFCRWYA